MNKLKNSKTVKRIISFFLVHLLEFAAYEMWKSPDLIIPPYVNGSYVLVNDVIRQSIFGIMAILWVKCFITLILDEKKTKKEEN